MIREAVAAEAVAMRWLDVLLAAYVEQRLLEWETVTLWVHRGDMVLPTYLRLRPAQL